MAKTTESILGSPWPYVLLHGVCYRAADRLWDMAAGDLHHEPRHKSCVWLGSCRREGIGWCAVSHAVLHAVEYEQAFLDLPSPKLPHQPLRQLGPEPGVPYSDELFFASLHAIGHLTGTFVYGSRTSHQEAVAVALGPDAVPRPYSAYVRSLPGWSGLTALILFWLISLASMPFIRKKSYELFQLFHLLMFPMIGLLCAHGTAALLQAPMMGYWLAFHALLVVFERSWRLIKGFMSIPARARRLDTNTIELTCKNPRGRDWDYSAGQYVLLQVPKVSWLQWHPFTISSCRGDILQLHIKLDGDWSNKLAEVLPEGENFRVGLGGPFGAPAQRFYDYDYSIIVGGGIGITPFSAILTDLEENFLSKRDPWSERRQSRSLSRPTSRRNSKAASDSEPEHNDIRELPRCSNPDRRVDFHWTVREKNQLLWFSDLLNRAIEGAYPLAKNGNLELNINTHITAKRKNISTHIFRYLLDSYRTPAAPYSALTGLKHPSHFGRPDFDAILEQHFQVGQHEGWKGSSRQHRAPCGALRPSTLRLQARDTCWPFYPSL